MDVTAERLSYMSIFFDILIVRPDNDAIAA